MSIRTIFRDNRRSGYREAWQNGAKVYEWSERDIDVMHNEVPKIVPEWGAYSQNTPVTPGKKRKK